MSATEMRVHLYAVDGSRLMFVIGGDDPVLREDGTLGFARDLKDGEQCRCAGHTDPFIRRIAKRYSVTFELECVREAPWRPGDRVNAGALLAVSQTEFTVSAVAHAEAKPCDDNDGW